MPWGPRINSLALHSDNKRLDSKMSAWELLGPLLLLTAGREHVRNRALIIPVDNAGSVAIYRKGWCTSCMLCTTLALAISEVATSLNCNLEIVKIRRCSNRAARAADALSKADWNRFRGLRPHANPMSAKVPQLLKDWVDNPVEDCTLGERILAEIGVERNILGLVDRFK